LKQGSWPSEADYSDLLELFEREDVTDEDIARDMKIDIKTVWSLRKEFLEEEMLDGPSTLFRNR
jgi:hypothetical protein